MNLEPSSEQLALVDTVKSVCDRHFNMEILHRLSDDFDAAVYDAGFKALADLGLFSLILPEEKGGVGLGFAEAALVFEELGRHIVPGPILGSFLFSSCLNETGEQDSQPKVEVLQVQKSAETGGEVVANFGLIDKVLLLEEDGIYCVDAEALELEKASHPLDPLTPVGILPEKFVENLWGKVPEMLPDAALSDSTQTDSTQNLEKINNTGALLASAFQTGLAEGALNLAVDYAGQRQQFSAPIGSFQAVKHLCADMLTLVEVARAALYSAAAAMDENAGSENADSANSGSAKAGSPNAEPESTDVQEHISAARTMSIKAAEFCSQSCVQVYGGMGYTWEADPHLYLKRAWALSHQFGSSDFHNLRLANMMENFRQEA